MTDYAALLARFPNELTSAAVAALKPCPFCGRKGALLKGKRFGSATRNHPRNLAHWERQAGEWIWKPSVGCKACGIYREFDSVGEAVAWWNYREQSKGEFKAEVQNDA